MSFKKTAILTIFVSLISMANAFENESLKVLNKIMDEGVIVNKHIETSSEQVDLVIYKGLVSSEAAYALLKLTNNKSSELKVKDIVKDGMPIKEVLSAGESTYIIVEERKIENSNNMLIAEKRKKNNVLSFLKNSDFKSLIKSIEPVFDIYYISKQSKIIPLPKYKLKEFLNSVKYFDYYSYVDLDIQKGLYRGIFMNGYETLKNGKVNPKTYYFIVDNLSGEIAYIYVMNEKVNYEELSKMVKGK